MPLERYLLIMHMFKISVCFDFTLVMICRITLIILLHLYPVISDTQASEIQKCKDLATLLYFVKTGLFPQKSCWIEVSISSSFWICIKISMCGEKCTLDGRITECPLKAGSIHRGLACICTQISYSTPKERCRYHNWDFKA